MENSWGWQLWDGAKNSPGIHSLENVTNPAKTFNVQYSHDGASVPIVAGKMVCFINPLTIDQTLLPAFLGKIFKIHLFHPFSEYSFSIRLRRRKCYDDFEL